MRELTPADDNLHKPTSDDIFWTETAWFSFAVPERRLIVFSYPVFRTNQNICSCGIYIWDDKAQANHEVLYAHNYWHLPMPDDLTKMRLPSGLSYDVLEPLKKYRVRYDSEDVKYDVVFEGLFPPQLAPKEDHLDQPCHVIGWIELFGERLQVDCFEMRDKSWHLRSDHPLKLPEDISSGGYSYGIRGDASFLVRSFGSDKNATKIFTGWLHQDGVTAAVVSGARRVERVPGNIGNRVALEATDELGRHFTAVGLTVNRYANQSTPAITAYLSGTEWDFLGQTTWGEDQEWNAGSSREARRF